jgi:hypothetical protein
MLFSVLLVACGSFQLGTNTGQNSNNAAQENDTKKENATGNGTDAETSRMPVVMEFWAEW